MQGFKCFEEHSVMQYQKITQVERESNSQLPAINAEFKPGCSGLSPLR